MSAEVELPDDADAKQQTLHELVAYRRQVLEEAARALLAVDPIEWALAGQHAGHDAAALIRRLADA